MRKAAADLRCLTATNRVVWLIWLVCKNGRLLMALSHTWRPPGVESPLGVPGLSGVSAPALSLAPALLP
jgi:hypothetical protein